MKLMLIGHERGSSAIASLLAEMLKAMMREAALKNRPGRPRRQEPARIRLGY